MDERADSAAEGIWSRVLLGCLIPGLIILEFVSDMGILGVARENGSGWERACSGLVLVMAVVLLKVRGLTPADGRLAVLTSLLGMTLLCLDAAAVSEARFMQVMLLLGAAAAVVFLLRRGTWVSQNGIT